MPTEAFVSAIAYGLTGGRNHDKNLLITVTIQDDFGATIEGASVSISLYRDGSSSGTGTASTGADGTVAFQLRNANSGCYTTDVTGMTNTGLIYDGAEPANEFCK